MDDMKLIPQVRRYSEPCSFLWLSSTPTSRSASRHELFICCLSREAIESAQEFAYLKWFLQFSVFPLRALSCMSESEKKLGSSWNERSDKRVTARRCRLWRTSVRDLRPHQLQLPSSKRSSKTSAKPSLLALLDQLSAALQLCQFSTLHFKGNGSPLQSDIIYSNPCSSKLL